MPPEDEVQQQQPTLLTEESAGSPVAEVGSGGEADQPTFKRVTPEEAESLPYDELKRRMKEERRLSEEGLLPEAPETSETDGEDDELGASTAGGNRGQVTAQQPGGDGRQDSELQRLLKEAQERTSALERQAAADKAAREQQELEAQHRRVEAEIASLPQQQQALARQTYMNRLGQQALNEYYGHLQQRETHLRQAELAQARTQLPNLLGELAESVAQRHGVRPDTLKSYVTSAEFRELLNASQTEEALTLAAANAGQWMDYLAKQEATRLATAREQRRLKAVADPKVRRDTPTGGAPTAGGEMDVVRRIESMSKDEFFAWKKQQLKLAQT